MIKKAILLLFLIMVALYSYSCDDANQLLNRAKAEAKGLYSPLESIRPKKNSDDTKNVSVTYASGKQFVDRKQIALDLFERAANAGSGEAAYILFCYNWLGRYDKHTCFQPKWDEFADSAVDMCFSSLQRAADLHFPKALEFLNYINDVDRTTKVSIYEDLILIYEAISGNPISEMNLAMRYRNLNPQKYEYWMEKSINHKEWPLLARTDYALYLLDSDKRADAISVIKPAEKKTKYNNDITARRGIDQLFLFYIADCLYKMDIEGAIKACDNLYNEASDYMRLLYDDGVIDKFSEAHDYNYLECCVNYFYPFNHRRLIETIYALNMNPKDRTVLYNRGVRYETFNDSVKAFSYYKSAALKQQKRAILKTFDYATKGYNLSNSEITDLLSVIIESENRETGEMSISRELANWKVYFILAEYFYKSDNRDYRKASTMYHACVTAASDCPRIIKGECARQLFKCFEFGRGVSPNHDTAIQWLEYAKSMGDHNANDISKVLYNFENSF